MNNVIDYQHQSGLVIISGLSGSGLSSTIGQIINQLSIYQESAKQRKPVAITVGEIRNEEAIQAALELALSESPVFGTVHSHCVKEVLPRLCHYIQPEDKESFLIKFLSHTKLIINKKIVKNIQTQKNIEVFEYLRIDENLKNELLESKDADQIIGKIRALMDRSDGKGNASLSFEAQGELLLDQGHIDDCGYKYLSNREDDDLDTD